MKLYVFNPEHDIALAHGTPLFTAPKAGRQLRSDLGFLPALWAEQGDLVWVEEPTKAMMGAMQLNLNVSKEMFVDTPTLRRLSKHIDRVEPWGWDAAIAHSLQRLGISNSVLPTPDELTLIRQDSHRKQSKVFLDRLHSIMQEDRVIGESVEVKEEQELLCLMDLWKKVVLKSPWSSSGRGVRMVEAPLNEAILCWAASVLRHQGSLMVEPMYEKLLDFGMEFSATRMGVSYLGLSLFDTCGSAYTGNLIADECVKRQLLGRYINLSLVDTVRESILHLFPQVFPRYFFGPFGVDMMVVRAADGTLRIHPCVEINFRITMGHVALAFGKQAMMHYHSMKVAYVNGRYQLQCI